MVWSEQGRSVNRALWSGELIAAAMEFGGQEMFQKHPVSWWKALC